MRKVLIISIMLLTIVAFKLDAMEKKTVDLETFHVQIIPSKEINNIQKIVTKVKRYNQKDGIPENAIKKFKKKYIVSSTTFGRIMWPNNSQCPHWFLKEIEKLKNKKPRDYERHTTQALYKLCELKITQENPLSKKPKLNDFRFKILDDQCKHLGSLYVYTTSIYAFCAFLASIYIGFLRNNC